MTENFKPHVLLQYLTRTYIQPLESRIDKGNEALESGKLNKDQELVLDKLNKQHQDLDNIRKSYSDLLNVVNIDMKLNDSICVLLEGVDEIKIEDPSFKIIFDMISKHFTSMKEYYDRLRHLELTDAFKVLYVDND